ncbi:MAG: polymer-forming cytoskeletal protein [Pseudomonadota bacterium]
MFRRNSLDVMESLVGAATQVDGQLQFSGGLRIDGRVRGDVVADPEQHSYLVISEHGRVDGEVRCAHLVVNGEIRGAVLSTELLEIQPKARIIGDVQYNILEMHGGALIAGRLSRYESDTVLHLAVSEA